MRVLLYRLVAIPKAIRGPSSSTPDPDQTLHRKLCLPALLPPHTSPYSNPTPSCHVLLLLLSISCLPISITHLSFGFLNSPPPPPPPLQPQLSIMAPIEMVMWHEEDGIYNPLISFKWDTFTYPPTTTTPPSLLIILGSSHPLMDGRFEGRIKVSFSKSKGSEKRIDR